MDDGLDNNTYYNNGYVRPDDLTLITHSCNVCGNANLFSPNYNLYKDMYSYEGKSICDNSDYDYDLLLRLEEAHMQLGYRGFQIVDMLSQEELQVLSQIKVSDNYFDSIYSVEDRNEDQEYSPRNHRMIFFPEQIEPTLCELLCKIGISNNQIESISSIVSKVLYSVKNILGDVSILARISAQSNQGITWHFDDFGSGNLYEGTLFTFSILGPGTLVYNTSYEDFPLLQNHIEKGDRVGYNDSLVDESKILESNIGQGVFLPYGADVGTLHSAPLNHEGARIVFIVRTNDVYYHPNFNECPVAPKTWG